MLRNRPPAHVSVRRWTAGLAVALIISLAALPERVNAQDAPDLIIREVSLSTTVARDGDAVTAHVTVRNYGRGPAAAFSLGLYFAARRDAPIDGMTELGRLVVGALAPGASAARSLTFRVPVVAPGTFYVIAQADVAGVVAEASDRNNRRWAALQIVLPDLAVDSLIVTPSTARAGDTVNVRARVRNIGRVFAKATEGTLHFAASPTALGGGTLQSTFPVPELAAGASEQLNLSLVVPPVAPGLFYVVARADGADGIQERSELNNQRWAVLRVATADLIISRFTATPATVTAASTIHGVIWLQNRALVSSDPTTARLYIAASPDVDLATVRPMATTSVPEIGPRGRATLDIPTTVPSLSYGTQYLIVQIGADSPGPSLLAAQTRTSLLTATAATEASSASVGPRGSTRFTVGSPDLVISGLTVNPAEVTFGGSVFVSLTVRNQGDATAPSSIVGLNIVPRGSSVPSGLAPLSTVSLDALAPRAYATVTATVPVTGLGPGGYDLVAEADWSRAVPESQDDNNRSVAALQVTGPSSPSNPLDLEPQVDPSQLDMPWPKHSHYKQPWKAWLETVPAYQFRSGVGIAYNWNAARPSDDIEMRLLAEAGVSRIRVEVGWNHIDYDTLDLTAEARARLTSIARAVRAQGIRPLILLNANHGIPGPARKIVKTVAAGAASGSRTVRLTDVTGIQTGYTGFSYLSRSDYKMAEVLITAIDSATGRVTLSKPLPVGLAGGQQVTLHTLRYRPLSEPGTAAFEETVGGWLQYARIVLGAVVASGVQAFDVEIWNELTFGSDFLHLNRYYDPPAVQERDYLQPGGRAWELARRTVTMLASEFPQAVPIWGFSNVTFFGVAVTNLPPGIKGQSYHPYFFLDYDSLEAEQYGFENNLEGFAPATPPYRVLMPETAGTYIKTESLARLINPAARTVRPSQSSFFDHYMTEFGLNPSEYGVTDESTANMLKAKMVLRSSLFWLNKGLRGLWYFEDLGTGDPTQYDLLPAAIEGLSAYPSDPRSHLGEPLRALASVSDLFRSSEPIAMPRQLTVEAQAADGSGGGEIFGGDSTHPPLTYQDVLTVLPFQVNARQFVVAVYVMSRNILKSLPDTTFTVRLSNVSGETAGLRYVDPISQRDLFAEVVERTPDSIVVRLPVGDSPHLLVISEN